jgi:ATP-dependent RNA helicase SUPV3L1/SUV3
LLTGQEVNIITDSTHVSCTVEKVDLNNYYHCALIDEIQLISDPARGAAWTDAFLGLRADEIHLCGAPSVFKLIYELCLTTGDDLIKKRYNRLGKLEVEETPFKNFEYMNDGDCIVGFNTTKLLQYRNNLNKESQRCAIVYGNLPPKTKKEQVKMFNFKMNEIKYLCATDAVKYIFLVY